MHHLPLSPPTAFPISNRCGWVGLSDVTFDFSIIQLCAAAYSCQGFGFSNPLWCPCFEIVALPTCHISLSIKAKPDGEALQLDVLLA
ncbi:hypothetical protein VNO78_28615 [Psophocarpus tetragonolobus]|uniref:Uncharacterized protein n=1 Tax=Psophocarpus tetragonolobus TaxID=3891 RepID=A0AAN9X0N3_PSOTE